MMILGLQCDDDDDGGGGGGGGGGGVGYDDAAAMRVTAATITLPLHRVCQPQAMYPLDRVMPKLSRRLVTVNPE